MKITILDYYASERREYKSIAAARSAESGFEYYSRYVNDWNLKNDAKFNEWLEVNCHNNETMIVPSSALHRSADLFAMVEYWHESIAFGRFGDESVAFNWHDDKLQREWDQFTTDKWLAANLQTIDDLETWNWHDECSHEVDDEGDLTPAGEADLADCEEYQIDQYIYDTGSGYYGAADIDRGTKRAYIMQINEYAEA